MNDRFKTFVHFEVNSTNGPTPNPNWMSDSLHHLRFSKSLLLLHYRHSWCLALILDLNLDSHTFTNHCNLGFRSNFWIQSPELCRKSRDFRDRKLYSINTIQWTLPNECISKKKENNQLKAIESRVFEKNEPNETIFRENMVIYWNTH